MDTKERVFVIEGSQGFGAPLERVWAALRDPVAYFTWNPVARLVAPISQIEDGMQVTVESPLMGRFTYVHRVDPAMHQVTHAVDLKIRILPLGHEFHRWTVEPAGEGCLVRQVMDVHLTTWAGRPLAGKLEQDLRKLFQENFDHLAAWLPGAPPLVGDRFPISAAG